MLPFYLGAGPQAPGFSALKAKVCQVKGRIKMRPSYFGHPSGARVAPQRCPILRKDKNKIYYKTDNTRFFY